MAKSIHESTVLQAIDWAVDDHFGDGNTYRGFTVGSEMSDSGVLTLKLWENERFMASGCDVSLDTDHEFVVKVVRRK